MAPVPSIPRRPGLAAALIVAGLLALPGALLADAPAAGPESIGGQPVVQISSGGTHSCALIQSGQVWCWGANGYGQLGDGTVTTRLAPVRVRGLADISEVAAGSAHTCARRATGRVVCWGANFRGQLGNGTTTDSSTPVAVAGLRNVIQIAAGAAHVCALHDNGRASCWGANGNGRLGDGTRTDRLLPVRVQGLARGLVRITAGAFHSCALRGNGRAICWGDGSSGQLGDGTTDERLTPVTVLGPARNLTGIAGGLNHTCATATSGRVFCWGSNLSGQLGDGTTLRRTTPVRVTGQARDVQSVSVGNAHSCALHQSGQAVCWGNNFSGQLGDGTTDARLRATRVRGLPDGVAIATGGSHTCALRFDGSVSCWGRGADGQLGNGTTDIQLTPTPVGP